MTTDTGVTQLYSVLESVEVGLGGGGGFEGFYGSVTAGGLRQVYEAMEQNCNFGKDSFLVDIGGGLGRPLMHALLQPGVEKAVGIELDEIKCMKSESVIMEACKRIKMMGKDVPSVPLVLHRDIEKVNASGTLDPATHAYSFWEGVPTRARCAFGQLFAKSSTLQCVAVVQRAVRKGSPEDFMANYGFGPLELVASCKGIHMSGSQRSFAAYIFKRVAPPGPKFSGHPSLLLSSYLDAPRLLQVTLPRLLRARKPRVANGSADAGAGPAAVRAPAQKAPTKGGGRRGRTAKQLGDAGGAVLRGSPSAEQDAGRGSPLAEPSAAAASEALAEGEAATAVLRAESSGSPTCDLSSQQSADTTTAVVVCADGRGCGPAGTEATGASVAAAVPAARVGEATPAAADRRNGAHSRCDEESALVVLSAAHCVGPAEDDDVRNGTAAVRRTRAAGKLVQKVLGPEVQTTRTKARAAAAAVKAAAVRGNGLGGTLAAEAGAGKRGPKGAAAAGKEASPTKRNRSVRA